MSVLKLTLCSELFSFHRCVEKENHINTVPFDNTALALPLVLGSLLINSKMSFLTRDCDSTLGVVVGDQITPRHQVL